MLPVTEGHIESRSRFVESRINILPDVLLVYQALSVHLVKMNEWQLPGYSVHLQKYQCLVHLPRSSLGSLVDHSLSSALEGIALCAGQQGLAQSEVYPHPSALLWSEL